MAGNERNMSVEELETEALKLPPVERERLAMKLLSTVETIPADQVIREALDRLK